MLALTYNGSSLESQPRYPEPTLQVGEALIRPTRLGICSTDIEICRGYMQFQGVLGHEFVGIVESIEGQDDRKLIGRRVVGAINAVCGECDLCKRGLATHCRARTVLGIAGRDGCFAEHFTLPVANLIPVPDSVEDDAAVFAEPLAAALHAATQIHIQEKPYITILGDGRLGLLCAQVFAPLNATVRVIGKHPDKMNLCEKWGIRHRHLDDIGRRADQDIVVDCTGNASGFAIAMQLVRPRGTILLKTTVAPPAAGTTPDHPIDLSPIVIHEINVIGSRCGSMVQAIDALSHRRIDVLSLVTRRFKLQDGIKAMQTAAQPDSLKVLMDV